MIINKVITLSRDQEFIANNSDIITFKFSSKWLDGFLARYDLCDCHRITVSQQLLLDLLEKQNIFLSYILYRRIQYDYPLKYIGNMDEIPMWFDLPSNTTIDHKGTKTVTIRITRHKHLFFIVILAYMADGSKLLAICIFKLKNLPKENFPYGIHIRVNEKGWMNE